MNISLSINKRTRPLLTINSQLLLQRSPHKEKVVVVMGATATGKSRLSIDLATHFAAEVINSDKIQVHSGLDIATNKITDEERRGVPHHLLGVIDPDNDFTATNFKSMASISVKSIHSRRKLPIIVGGSNSFIENLIDANFRAKYDCCFLCVDVAMPVLHSTVSNRVDKMVERGLVDEVREFYSVELDYSRGIRKAIGVPELDRFFRVGSVSDDLTRGRILTEALDQIKSNTSKLARKQVDKIRRLRNTKGWRVRRLDATEVLKRRGEDAEAAWEEMVAGPGVDVVRRFLYEMEPVVYGEVMAMRGGAAPLMATASMY